VRIGERKIYGDMSGFEKEEIVSVGNEEDEL